MGSEQAEHFTATAWGRLVMLLPLVDLYFREPAINLLAEIRLNEGKLGATPEDMQRLRWKVEPLQEPSATRGMFDHLRLEE